MTYCVQGRVLDLWETCGPSAPWLCTLPLLHPTSVPCATSETLFMWMGSSGFPIKSELYFSLFLHLWFITSKLSVVHLDVKLVQKSLKPVFHRSRVGGLFVCVASIEAPAVSRSWTLLSPYNNHPFKWSKSSKSFTKQTKQLAFINCSKYLWTKSPHSGVLNMLESSPDHSARLCCVSACVQSWRVNHSVRRKAARGHCCHCVCVCVCVVLSEFVCDHWMCVCVLSAVMYWWLRGFDYTEKPEGKKNLNYFFLHIFCWGMKKG